MRISIKKTEENDKNEDIDEDVENLVMKAKERAAFENRFG